MSEYSTKAVKFGEDEAPTKQTSPSDEQWDKMTSKQKDDYIYKNTPGGNPYTNPEDKEFYGKKTGNTGYDDYDTIQGGMLPEVNVTPAKQMLPVGQFEPIIGAVDEEGYEITTSKHGPTVKTKPITQDKSVGPVITGDTEVIEEISNRYTKDGKTYSTVRGPSAERETETSIVGPGGKQKGKTKVVHDNPVSGEANAWMAKSEERDDSNPFSGAREWDPKSRAFKQKSPNKQMTKYSDIPTPTESDTNYSGDLYKKPSIVASDERKKSVREQVGDYNTSIDEYNEKVKMVGKYRKAKNMIKDALYVPKPGRLRAIDPEDYYMPYKHFKKMYSDEKGRISTPHSPKKK
jgi:hypothetical protein